MSELNECEMGNCPSGDPDCPGCQDNDGIFVIWWLTQHDCEALNAILNDENEGEVLHASPEMMLPPDWPAYLGEQLCSRWGRSGRGRLWNARSGEWLPNGIEPWPDTMLSRRLSGNYGDSGNAGGIVMPLRDVNHVIGLPGLVTNDRLQRLCVHGVDVDL